MDLCKKVLGPNHPDTLTIMENLAVTYSNQGDYEKAGEMQLKVLDMHKSVLGPEHPSTLTSMDFHCLTCAPEMNERERWILVLKDANC